jgi:hypothetical protein
VREERVVEEIRLGEPFSSDGRCCHDASDTLIAALRGEIDAGIDVIFDEVVHSCLGNSVPLQEIYVRDLAALLGHVTYAFDGPEINGYSSALLLRYEMFGEGILERVPGGVVGLAAAAQGGDGREHREEVHVLGEHLVQIDCSSYLGPGCSYPVLMGHVGEHCILFISC